MRLERTVSWSQTRRDTNFAIPGYLLFQFLKILLSVVKAVVRCNFEVLFSQQLNSANARVPKVSGVPPLPAPDTGTALPKQARYQLRYTPLYFYSCYPKYNYFCGFWVLSKQLLSLH